MFKKQGKTDEELDKQFPDLEPFEIPLGFEHILMAFTDMSSARHRGEMGNLHPISYLEIQAYCNLMGIELDPFEIETIRLMDMTLINELNTLNNSKAQ